MSKIIEPHRIEIPLGIMFHTVNCYLFPGKELTLVDCGLQSEGNWNILQTEIKKHGFDVKEIDQLIITHEHPDHIGLLHEILDASHCKVKAPEIIKRWFSDPDEMTELERTFTIKMLSSLGFPKDELAASLKFLQSSKPFKKIKDLARFEYFKEGDYLEIGHSKWEALNTPGHCPSQFVFLQAEQRRLISGDMLLPIAPMPIVVENPNDEGEPVQALKQLLASFERLRLYEIGTVYPGHGEIFSDANAMIDKQLARMKMRKEECFEAIKSGMNTPYQVNRQMYPYQTMPPDFSGMHMVMGYIDLLRTEGRIIVQKDDEGQLFVGAK